MPQASPSSVVSTRSTAKDSLARFYTKERIGDLLVQALGPHQPDTLVDLGCGLGALSFAASRRWDQINIVTVDIDANAQHKNWGNENIIRHSHRHISGDVLSEDIFAQVMNERVGGFDAVLSNPPFARPKWRPCYERIIEGAGLSNIVAFKTAASADVLFLAQALRLIRYGGCAGFILPEGLIAGSKSEKIRNFLIENHQITNVIALPADSFDGIEVNTHLLTLRKGRSSEPYRINVSSMRKNGELVPAIQIDRVSAGKRLDYDYHSAKSVVENDSVNLASIGADIRRGSITSVACRSAPDYILHTTNFYSMEIKEWDKNNPPLRTLVFSNETLRDEVQVKANAGDIVIARVGRNLQQKLAIVAAGSVSISDCVFRIRVPAQFRVAVATELASERGQHWLKAVSHGAGAMHITKAELLEFPLPRKVLG